MTPSVNIVIVVVIISIIISIVTTSISITIIIFFFIFIDYLKIMREKKTSLLSETVALLAAWRDLGGWPLFEQGVRVKIRELRFSWLSSGGSKSFALLSLPSYCVG